MRAGTTGLAGTTPLSRFTTWDYLSPSARLGLISSGYSGYGQELGKFTLLGCSASVSGFISPTTCSYNWSRQHSGTAAGKRARLESYPPVPEGASCFGCRRPAQYLRIRPRSEEHTSELQSIRHLV